MMKYGEFETSFTEGKHLEQSIFPLISTFLPWDLTFISLCNVKQVKKCHLFTRKILLEEFCLPTLKQLEYLKQLESYSEQRTNVLLTK